MSIWRIEATIMPKDGVNDPQGEAIRGGLVSLDFTQVQDVRAGKIVAITIEADSRQRAMEQGTKMCEQLLANPVIESFTLTATEQTAVVESEARS